MKKGWYSVLGIYLGLVLLVTLAVQGRSMLEWVELLIPPGALHSYLIYLLHHHHPVTFTILLRLADTCFNLVFFLPVGVGMFFALRRVFPDNIRMLLLAALLGGLCLSIGIETVQYLVPKRVPALSDVIANTGGAVFGCYAVYFWKMRQIIRQRRLHETTTGKP